MEHLNDDILIQILSYLDLESQKIMIDVHPRFHNLISHVWRSEYKTVKLSLFESNFTVEHFRHFIESICERVEVLHLRMMNKEQFDVLISHTYPLVHDFRFAVVSNQLLSDEDVPKIVIAFPNLKTFSPHGNFSGLYFANFPKLERLTLSYCRNFKVNNLATIMNTHLLKELKLGLFDQKTIESSDISLPVERMTNLESLKIEYDELIWFENHLQGLKTLKELIVHGPYQPNSLGRIVQKMDIITNPRHFKILETCNARDTLRTVVLNQLRVDALKIVTDNFLLDNVSYFNPRRFQNIKQLYFKNCFIQGRYIFDNLMWYILGVDLVSFEQCIFAFNDYVFNAFKITENRQKVLKVNLYENTYLKTVSP